MILNLTRLFFKQLFYIFFQKVPFVLFFTFSKVYNPHRKEFRQATVFYLLRPKLCTGSL